MTQTVLELARSEFQFTALPIELMSEQKFDESLDHKLLYPPRECENI